MKIDVDLQHSLLSIQLRDAAVADSEEICPGVLFDYDAAGRLAGVEFLNVTAMASPSDLAEIEVILTATTAPACPRNVAEP